MATRLGAPIGAQDGANRNFATSTAYAPGSLAVRVNTTTLASGDVSEIDAGGGLFTLADPPLLTDVVTVAYRDPSSTEPGARVGPQTAFVKQIAELSYQGGQDFTFYAGQSGGLLEGTVFDKEGDAFDLTGSQLFFLGRKDAESGAVLFDKTVDIEFFDQSSSSGIGRFRVTFTSAETQAASANFVRWDLWIRPFGSDDLVPMVGGGRIEVRAAIRTSFA